MSIVTFILVIVAFILLWLNFHIKALRKISYERMEGIYDKMLMIATKNKLPVTRDLKRFLVNHKVFIVNPELLEIDVILGILNLISEEEIHKISEKEKLIRKELPEELTKLSVEFESEIIRNTKLGAWINYRFISFVLFQIFKLTLKSAITFSFEGIKSKFNRGVEIIENELNLGYNLYTKVQKC